MGLLIYIDDTIEESAMKIAELQSVKPHNEYLEKRLHLATMLQQLIGEQVTTLIVSEHGKAKRLPNISRR